MWCLILGYYFKGLTAGRAEPQDLCCSDSSIAAGQSCWYSRLKVSGGPWWWAASLTIVSPQIPSRPVGVLVMFPIWWHFKAMCVGSRSVNDGELLTTWKDRLTVCRQRGESMNENAQLFDVRWKETGSVCCTATLLCSAKGLFFFYWRGMCLISWKYSLDFGGIFIPYFITVEGLLCVCSFLLCLPRFLPARPIWSPDSFISACYSCVYSMWLIDLWFTCLFFTAVHRNIHATIDKKKLK